MIKSRWFAAAGASALCFATVWLTNVPAPAQEPTYPLYCRGPLKTSHTDGGKTIKTGFKWAKESALKERPAAGQCAWADTTPPGFESKPDTEATLVGDLGPFDDLPVGTVLKICVTKASSGEDLAVRRIIRHRGHATSPFHIPPYSAEAVEACA